MKNVKKYALMSSLNDFQSARLSNDDTRNVNGGDRWTYDDCGCGGLDWVGSGPPDEIPTIT